MCLCPPSPCQDSLMVSPTPGKMGSSLGPLLSWVQHLLEGCPLLLALPPQSTSERHPEGTLRPGPNTEPAQGPRHNKQLGHKWKQSVHIGIDTHTHIHTCAHICTPTCTHTQSSHLRACDQMQDVGTALRTVLPEWG